jgi:hypothetical protein
MRLAEKLDWKGLMRSSNVFLHQYTCYDVSADVRHSHIPAENGASMISSYSISLTISTILMMITACNPL